MKKTEVRHSKRIRQLGFITHSNFDLTNFVASVEMSNNSDNNNSNNLKSFPCGSEVITEYSTPSSLSQKTNSRNKRKNHEPENEPPAKRPKEMLDKQKAHAIFQAAVKLEDLNIQNLQTVIGVVGNTSSGKSTLINTILKTKPLPTASTACTGFNIKIQMVKPNDIPSNYQLTFHQTLWNNTKDYSSAEEVVSALKEEFQPYMRMPNFKKTATLTIADPHAIQMVMVDTPGSRGGNTYSEILTNMKNLNVIVLCVKYTAGIVHTLHPMLDSCQLHPLRLVIVITHIDNILKDHNDNLKILVDSVKKTIEDFTSKFKSLDIVAVQCVDPFHPNECWEKHREEERKTIQHIQKEISSELRQAPTRVGMLWGVEQLTDLLMQYYISGMDRSVLTKVKNELDVQNQLLKEEITRKKKEIVPSKKTSEILLKLNNKAPHAIERTAQQTKTTIMKTVLNTIENMDAPKSKKPPQQPGFISSLFGPSEIYLSFEEQETAQTYARKVVLGIQPHVVGLVKQVGEIYREFLVETTEEEAEQCSRLMKELNTFFTRYFSITKVELENEIGAWITRSGFLTKLCFKAEQSIHVIQLPDCKLTRESTTNPVAAKANRIIGFVLTQLVHNIMAYFIEKIFENFPAILNSHLAKLTEPWAGATEEELAALEDNLLPTLQASNAIQAIVDSTS